MSEPEQPDGPWPLMGWWPAFAGALLGVALRLLYSGNPDGAYAAMTAGFIYLAPIVVGAITVYLGERQTRRSFGYHLGMSALANVLFVAGTMVILIEGLICAIIVLPLFVLLGMFGGALMALVCRFTRWPNQTMGSLVLLPLLLGSADSGFDLPANRAVVERSVVVRAPPDIVWREILNTSGIRPVEVERAWVYRIGVPLPVDGQMLDGASPPTRRVHMGKNVYFDEIIEEERANERIRWTYRFHGDSFPPYAFDEHVVVGGRYFDVNDTSYDFEATPAGTVVRMTLSYRVSTRFNWYAAPVARWLLGNLVESNLTYYRQRSELTATRVPER